MVLSFILSIFVDVSGGVRWFRGERARALLSGLGLKTDASEQGAATDSNGSTVAGTEGQSNSAPQGLGFQKTV